MKSAASSRRQHHAMMAQSRSAQHDRAPSPLPHTSHSHCYNSRPWAAYAFLQICLSTSRSACERPQRLDAPRQRRHSSSLLCLSCALAPPWHPSGSCEARAPPPARRTAATALGSARRTASVRVSAGLLPAATRRRGDTAMWQRFKERQCVKRVALNHCGNAGTRERGHGNHAQPTGAKRAAPASRFLQETNAAPLPSYSPRCSLHAQARRFRLSAAL